MTKTLEAIYENGHLRLMEPLGLRESSHVRVQIEIPDPPDSHAVSGPIVALERLAELTKGVRTSGEDLQTFMDRVRERDE